MFHRSSYCRPRDGDGTSGRRFARGPFGQEGGQFGRRHHGGGRERLFDQGDLRFVLLKLIADKPSHGYELIKAIEDRLGGAYSPSPGVVYPTLTLLEELGYVEVTAEGGKKRYAATEEGRQFLAANQAMVDQIFARIDSVGGGAGRRGPALPIVRAMENLKTALRLRFAQGSLTDEQARAIAAALDAAAVQIERE